MGKEKKDDIKKSSADIEGGPEKEAEVKLEDFKDAPEKDKSLEEREKSVATRETEVESKIKEISESQELFRKEWDEKTAELDAIKELHETDDRDLEDIEFKEDDVDLKPTEDPKPKEDELEENKSLDTGFENMVKKEIIEEQNFRKDILKRQDNLEANIAETDLSKEIDLATEAYPKMDKREVLIEVQRDPSQKIDDLAKKSEEDFLAREAKMKEDLKVELKNEADGVEEETKKTETVPSEPVGETTPSRQIKSKDRWSQATKEAQDDMAEGDES